MSDRLLRRNSLPGLVDAHVHLVYDASLGALERVGQHEFDQLDTVITASLARHAAADVTTVADLDDVDYRTLVHRDAAVPGAPWSWP
jgi:imidazolonepropionase-like amidohydrolase